MVVLVFGFVFLHFSFVQRLFSLAILPVKGAQ